MDHCRRGGEINFVRKRLRVLGCAPILSALGGNPAAPSPAFSAHPHAILGCFGAHYANVRVTKTREYKWRQEGYDIGKSKM